MMVLTHNSLIVLWAIGMGKAGNVVEGPTAQFTLASHSGLDLESIQIHDGHGIPTQYIWRIQLMCIK